MNIKSITFNIKKHSPVLLLGAGIAGIIGGTVMACKATPKAVQIMQEANETLETIHKVKDTVPEEKYSPDVFRRDIALTYFQTAGKLVKTYGPSMLVLFTGIGCVCGSHHILTKRNAALTAAYTLVNQGYSEYRKRVADKFGEEIDKQIRYGLVDEDVEEKIVDEKGKEKVKKEKKTVVTDITPGPYSVYFDPASRNWTDNPEDNLRYLMLLERHWNDKVKADQYVVWNEILKDLDIPLRDDGRILGWKWKPGDGDIISFGIHKDLNRRAINGYENVFILDFNVQGDVLAL